MDDDMASHHPAVRH